ncbi:MAG: helical backbone metal receptor [Candidatus Bathyarchaeota archaeon]|nr:helical backbone metal receptor [Candidatus Bathyarchaeota archaeon]
MDKNITYIIAIIAVISLIIGVFGFVSFEGQIYDLNNSVTDLEDELANKLSSISSLEGSLTAIEDTLDDLETQVGTYQSSITALEQQLGIYNSNISALEQQISEQQDQISDQQGQISEQQDQIDEYQQTIAEQQQQIAEYQTVTLLDGYGNVVTLTEFPERIVSLAPSNTEILFALGLGDYVVGVTDFCDYPYDFSAWVAAGNMSSIGSYYGPSAEPIVSLEPDLVLATSASLDAADTLKNLGYAVLVIEGHTINDVFDDILLVGRATYKNTEAISLVASLRARMATVAETLLDATTTPKVYYELWYEPLMSAGPETFINEIITLAGGTNIFADATTSWPMVSSEEIITKNPDVILLPDTYMSDQIYNIADVYNRPGWDSITAIQNEALYEIVENTIVRSGPRIVDAIETIAALIHPELFG